MYWLVALRFGIPLSVTLTTTVAEEFPLVSVVGHVNCPAVVSVEPGVRSASCARADSGGVAVSGAEIQGDGRLFVHIDGRQNRKNRWRFPPPSTSTRT